MLEQAFFTSSAVMSLKELERTSRFHPSLQALSEAKGFYKS
jgi:hypothetical protein|tara:strand:- start:62 stop:184 length:123 start_codon:yes stop_codon:yes gene_type:complete